MSPGSYRHVRRLMESKTIGDALKEALHVTVPTGVAVVRLYLINKSFLLQSDTTAYVSNLAATIQRATNRFSPLAALKNRERREVARNAPH